MQIEELRKLQRAIIGHMTDLGKTIARSVTVSKFAIILAGAVAAWMQFVPAGTALTTSQVVGVVAAALVMIFGGYVLVAEKDAATMVVDAHSALAAAQESSSTIADYESELAALENQLGKSVELYVAMANARDIYEQALTTGNGNLDQLLRDLLTTSKRHFAAAMEFETTDRWTLCIYRTQESDNGPRELKLVAHVRAIECGVDEARVWPEGNGFAGISLSTGQEIIIGDMSEPAVGQIFNVSSTLGRPHDAMVYKSAIACPIYVGGDNIRPWGVATATNDRPGHFVDDEGPSVHNGEAVRAVANMTAMIVTLCATTADLKTQHVNE